MTNTTNTLIGNQEMFNLLIEQINKKIDEIKDMNEKEKDKNDNLSDNEILAKEKLVKDEIDILITLKIYLENEDLRFSYARNKSIFIIYNLIENFDLSNFGKNDIETIIYDFTNKFLEEDFELNIDLESIILNKNTGNINNNINPLLVYKYYEILKELFRNISIKNEGNEIEENQKIDGINGNEEIINLLKDKFIIGMLILKDRLSKETKDSLVFYGKKVDEILSN